MTDFAAGGPPARGLSLFRASEKQFRAHMHLSALVVREDKLACGLRVSSYLRAPLIGFGRDISRLLEVHADQGNRDLQYR